MGPFLPLGEAIAAAVLAVVPPIGSIDILNYAIYRRIADLGFDPYSMTPDQPWGASQPWFGGGSRTSLRHCHAERWTCGRWPPVPLPTCWYRRCSTPGTTRGVHSCAGLLGTTRFGPSGAELTSGSVPRSRCSLPDEPLAALSRATARRHPGLSRLGGWSIGGRFRGGCRRPSLGLWLGRRLGASGSW